MGNVLITGGGGSGVSSDELTSTANRVLENYTYVGADTDDEAGTGTMKDRNTVGKNGAVGISDTYPTIAITPGDTLQINQATDDNYYFAIQPEAGYYNGGSYVGALRSEVASVGGLTAAKLMQNQSAFGISGTATSDATATNDLVYPGRVYYAKGTRGVGTMKHLTNETTIQHATNNATKVILGDQAFISTNTDGVNRFEIRYNGDPGYITANTLFGIPTSTAASVGGLTASKLVKGQTAFGITGTGAGYVNANYSLWNGDIPATYVPSGSYGEAILLQNHTITNATLASANIIVIETKLGTSEGFNTVLMINSTNSYILEQDGGGNESGVSVGIPNNTAYKYYPYFSIIAHKSNSTIEIDKMSIRIKKSSGSGTLPQTSGLSIKITHCFTV